MLHKTATWKLILAPALLLTAAACAPEPVGEPTIAVQGATLIDGTGSAPVENAILLVSGGKIRAVGSIDDVEVPAGATRIDASGKTAIPGIINLHGHVGMVKGLVQAKENFTHENIIANLKRYAKYGVTTTTSLGSDLDLMLDIRDRQRRGEQLGARVYTALQGFTVTGGYPTKVPGIKGVAIEVGDVEAVRGAVNELVEKDADVIKLWLDDHHDREPKLTPELYGAIIEQAHQRGAKVFAHVYELADAKGLVEANVDALAHSVRDAEVDDELINAMKEKGVASISTLVRELSTFVYAEPPTWLDDPFFRQAVPQSIADGLTSDTKAVQEKDPDREINIKGLEIAKVNLKKLSDAGVRIGFGTDSGPPGRFPGFFAHLEMELMQEAGLTPMQIIYSFSGVAAEVLGVQSEIGTLEPGKSADFVLLDEDPLEDIKAVRRIHAVYIGGEAVQ